MYEISSTDFEFLKNTGIEILKSVEKCWFWSKSATVSLLCDQIW